MMDKMEIASKFNTFYLAQHKLQPNQKKKEKIHRKQNGGRPVHKRIHNGGVKGSNKKHQQQETTRT
jgi:hypothetical protein